MGGPGDAIGVGMSTQQLAIFPIEHIEKAVLGCLQQHLAHLTVQLDFAEGDVHG